MKLLFFILIALVIWGLYSGYESIKLNAYNTGYDAGLNDGEIYFCSDIKRKSDSIYNWLKNERLC